MGALALRSGGVAYRLLGAWLVGVCVNYVPLAADAVSMFAPEALEGELADLDTRAEQRYYMSAQVLLFVPLLVALLAAQRSWQQPR